MLTIIIVSDESIYISKVVEIRFFFYIFFFFFSSITGQSFTHSNNKIINTKVINQASKSSTTEKKLYLVNNDCPVVVSLTEVWQTASLKLNPATKPAEKERDAAQYQNQQQQQQKKKIKIGDRKKHPMIENIARSFKLIILSYHAQCSPIILFRWGFEFEEKRQWEKNHLRDKRGCLFG